MAWYPSSFRRQHVCIPHQYPGTVWLPAKDRKRASGPNHRVAALLGDHADVELAPAVGQIVRNTNFLDVTCRLNAVLPKKDAESTLECTSAFHGRLTGDQEQE